MDNLPLYKAEDIERIIDKVGEGHTLKKALQLVLDEGFPVPAYHYFHTLVHNHNLDEAYYNACSSAKSKMEDDVLDEVDQLATLVPFEYKMIDGALSPVKYGPNSAAVSKLDLKYRMIKCRSGRIDRAWRMRGTTPDEQLQSINKAMAEQIITPEVAEKQSNVVFKQFEMSKLAQIQEVLMRNDADIVTWKSNK